MHLYIAFTGGNTREVLENFRPEQSPCILDTSVLFHLETGILTYWPGSPPDIDESMLWCLICMRLPSCHTTLTLWSFLLLK